jgi:hypothetical protein
MLWVHGPVDESGAVSSTNSASTQKVFGNFSVFFLEISPKHDRNFLLPVFQIAAVRVSQTDTSCIYLNRPPIAQSETASSRANRECSQHVFAAGQEIRSYMYLYVCLYPRVPRIVESTPFSWYRIARLRGWVSSERHSWVQRLPHQVGTSQSTITRGWMFSHESQNVPLHAIRSSSAGGLTFYLHRG